MIPLLITTIAGISTLFGIIPTYIKNINKDKLINFSLSFSAGSMITLSIFSLIPESFSSIKNIIWVLIFMNIGVIISGFIDNLISKETTNSLYKVGITSLIALILHNIPEGVITFISSSADLGLGITLAFGILLHNIPEGLTIAIPIYHSTNNHKKVFILVLISALSELVGGIVASLFLKDIITPLYLGIIYGITAGIMLEISFGELLKEAGYYNNKRLTFNGIIFGFLIMIICIFYFKL